MRRFLPPLHALRAFESAGRLGRMTLAAAELNVTPGAVSRQVRQLELSLDLPLFTGSKNKPTLTDAGAQLLPEISSVFDRIDAALRAVKDKDAGVVDVGCFSSFTLKWLIPRLYHFRQMHPALDIRLSATDDAVQPRRYDVVIGTAQKHELLPPENGQWLLFSEQLGPVLSPLLAAQMVTLVKDGRWNSAAVLLQTRTRQNAWRMWSEASGVHVPDTWAQILEHYYFTLEAAIGGLGVCMAPWHLVMDDVRTGRLEAPLGFLPSGYHYVATQSDHRNVHARQFCQWLMQQVESMPKPF